MRIVQVAAEFSPIAKAGGLGEVVLGLSRELTRSPELDVEVIIPKYDFIDLSKISNLKMEVPDFKCVEKGSKHPNAMWSGKCEECNLHLLEARHHAGYFNRGKIYGCEDDISRFIYFSRAVLEYLKLKKQPIDILHLHDWHVALCAPLVRDLFANDLQVKAILFTIHNSEYQGKCTFADLDVVGLKGAHYLVKEKLQDDDPAYPKGINLMKGGIVYADAVSAVSPTFAKELLVDKGFHLESTFRKYRSKLTGILNGIDSKLWDPATDAYLTARYSAGSSLQTVQAAKQTNKNTLQKKFNLSDKKPWLGSITRLVPQKGPELIEEAMDQTLQMGGVFFLLGSSPDLKLQTHFEDLKAQYGKSHEVSLQLIYDDALSHQLYSALDFLIVPSHFEPCGLSQLIAMRYGTIPIVCATGGLKDTVFDCEDPKTPIELRNGFLFPKPTKESMNPALKRAFEFFHKDPGTFQSLIRRAMQRDSSWKKPAQEYMKLYQKIRTVKVIAAEQVQTAPKSETIACARKAFPKVVRKILDFFGVG
ncbi:MAG TPA: glycogen synthase [Chlamydiales bacterium]|nr:glycogen synthase [Chlamydiales bacterium]